MSDYFARIVGRAAGGNAAPPLVHALPALYVPGDQSEALVAVDGEQIAPRPAPSAEALMAADGEQIAPPPAPAAEAGIPAPLRGPQTTQPASKPQPGTRPARATAETPLHQSHVPASPTTTPPERAPRIERTNPESTAKAVAPGAFRQTKPAAAREKTLAHADPAPAAKTITTETPRVFLRADPQHAPNNALVAHGPAAPETPTVIIGRIDVSVAPPAPPPRTAPDTRTRGFQSYARLRRGLVR